MCWVGWVGLGWVGLGLVGLACVRLGCIGLVSIRLGWVTLKKTVHLQKNVKQIIFIQFYIENVRNNLHTHFVLKLLNSVSTFSLFSHRTAISV